MVAGAAGAALTAQPHTGEWAGGVELWQVVVVPAWGRVCVWRTCWLRSDAVCDVCVCACWWRSSWVYWCASASVCKRMVPAGSWLARGETVTAAVGWEHGGRQHQSGCRDGGSSPEALLSRRQRTAGDYSWVEGCGHGGTAAERKKQLLAAALGAAAGLHAPLTLAAHAAGYGYWRLMICSVAVERQQQQQQLLLGTAACRAAVARSGDAAPARHGSTGGGGV
ncbi:hypothetical protein CHLRE_10g459226v5 [Chlamydomonas reinhardtii]|uniref:Uncharacterized protein n=1 Tax=Chlamydomonas reinhardtii TaxID=3055 RepID=A0A2K3DBR3_CHLRE|nr:uncharacterized protein CHLRE_10g459226v5 [Chlamydomonas reinhardtii]PNW77975.1 hypothetical protein CHLRE_10g459226v5 [Chlamydomonas reinhardtii]